MSLRILSFQVPTLAASGQPEFTMPPP
uniref:Uncharacterized protein n=1 Tax=Arundo donax TaxID=35708 RepID=A0A0A9ANN6_ARUDO